MASTGVHTEDELPWRHAQVVPIETPEGMFTVDVGDKIPVMTAEDLKALNEAKDAADGAVSDDDLIADTPAGDRDGQTARVPVPSSRSNGAADDDDYDGVSPQDATESHHAGKAARPTRGGGAGRKPKKRRRSSAPQTRKRRRAIAGHRIEGHDVDKGPPPKASFRVVEVDLPLRRVSPLPAEYITFDPPEDDDIVEYDMDEEDEVWLERIQAADKHMRKISISQFEAAMDFFEKKSFLKTIAGRIMHEDEDNAVCAVCLQGHSEEGNVIIFCDSCNVAVHQECYGVPFIPEGQWKCRKCQHAPSKAVRCILCPTPGGALKQTSDMQWVHVACAKFIRETDFDNPALKEPVTGIEDIPRERWDLTCYLCHRSRRKNGACVQCTNRACRTAFHVTCAQRAQLAFQESLDDRKAHSIFCHRHTPPGFPQPNVKQLQGTSRCTFGDSRPLWTQQRQAISVPQVDDKLLSTMESEVGLPTACIDTIKNYWQLKRRSRHGAPLLRRLQAQLPSGVEQLLDQRRKFFKIRQGLEKARILVGQVIRRERLKKEWFEVGLKKLMAQALPLQPVFRHLLGQLRRRDADKVFWDPVDTEEFPDYLRIVPEPMDLSTMEDKVDACEYVLFEDFVADFRLICDNCMKYNARSPWWLEYGKRFLHRGLAALEISAHRAAQGGIDLATSTLSSSSEPAPADAGLDQVYGFCGQLDEFEAEIRAQMVEARAQTAPAVRSQQMQRLSDKLEEHRISLRPKPVIPKNASGGRKKSKKSKKQGLSEADMPPQADDYHAWTLVWAKMQGDIWFPAELVDPHASLVDAPNPSRVAGAQILSALPPTGVIADVASQSSRAVTRGQDAGDQPSAYYLVHFFDGRGSWAWVQKKQLRRLLQDEIADQALISATKKSQKALKDAYSRAQAYHKETRGFRQSKALD